MPDGRSTFEISRALLRRPYAIYYFNKGALLQNATEYLNYAKQIAEKEHCYKIMFLTGYKEDATLNFYNNAGYNSRDKTAFIQWIDWIKFFSTMV